MVATAKPERMMPNRRVAYEYTCVMYLAQQFEENMRVILFLGDQWAFLPELKLTKSEKRRFKNDIGLSLSEAGTSGRLLNALEQAGLVKDRAHLAKIIQHRNELAHSFLVEADFDNLNAEREEKLIKRLHEMAFHFLAALTATRKIRSQFERESDVQQQISNKIVTEFGMPELTRESPQFKRKRRDH